jgi:hypothetical protein
LILEASAEDNRSGNGEARNSVENLGRNNRTECSTAGNGRKVAATRTTAPELK